MRNFNVKSQLMNLNPSENIDFLSEEQHKSGLYDMIYVMAIHKSMATPKKEATTSLCTLPLWETLGA